MTKLCTKCGLEKDVSEFSVRKDCKSGRASRCKSCRKEDYRILYNNNSNVARRNRWKNDPQYREYQLEYQRDWALKNSEKVRLGHVKRHRRKKKDVFNIYGHQCECCGETRFEFLAVDHVNGGGTKEREELGPGGVYSKLLKAGQRLEGYRLLCHNCNMSLGFFGFCPHQTKSCDGIPIE